jgi:hypothetical protein
MRSSGNGRRQTPGSYTHAEKSSIPKKTAAVNLHLFLLWVELLSQMLSSCCFFFDCCCGLAALLICAFLGCYQKSASPGITSVFTRLEG